MLIFNCLRKNCSLFNGTRIGLMRLIFSDFLFWISMAHGLDGCDGFFLIFFFGF